MTDFEAHLTRQIAFSRATFGPGARTNGVVDHIRKELVEVENAQNHEERVKEWTDVVMLALDGLMREIAWGDHRGLAPSEYMATHAVRHIVQKQALNETRTWPDWRTSDPEKAIEHVRTEGANHG